MKKFSSSALEQHLTACPLFYICVNLIQTQKYSNGALDLVENGRWWFQSNNQVLANDASAGRVKGKGLDTNECFFTPKRVG